MDLSKTLGVRVNGPGLNHIEVLLMISKHLSVEEGRE